MNATQGPPPVPVTKRGLRSHIESMDPAALFSFAKAIPSGNRGDLCALGLNGIIQRRDVCHAVGLRAVIVNRRTSPEDHASLVTLSDRMLGIVEDCDTEIDAAGAW